MQLEHLCQSCEQRYTFRSCFVFRREGSGTCPNQPAFANMPAPSDFKLAVDENDKATELPLLRVCGTVQPNPHMRAFWASTISLFLAFLDLLGLVCSGTFGARGGYQHVHVRINSKSLPTRRQPEASGLPEVQVTFYRENILPIRQE